MSDTLHNHVCPVEKAGKLDAGWRRILQRPSRLLKPFVKPGMTILDLGCGPGFFTLEIARMLGHSGKVIAADVQQGMLDILSAKLAQNKPAVPVELCLTRPDDMGISQPLDFVLAFYLIHEVPDRRKLFGQLHRLMRAGARFYISEPRFHVNRAEFEEMIRDLKQSGFRIISRPRVFFSRTLVAEKIG